MSDTRGSPSWLSRRRGRFDVPGQKRRFHRAGDFLGQNRFARARLAFDEQGALENDGGIDRHSQILGRHIRFSAFETRHSALPALFDPRA
jgi:hypothetical protein